MFFARSRHRSARRGVVLVLLAFMSVAMLVFAALVINWSYIELTRTQLQAAADAAAKAALLELSENQSYDDARQAARNTALKNLVAGHQLQLSDADIVFGNGHRDGGDRVVFTPDGVPTNSVRVDARRSGGSMSGAVPVLFAGFLQTKTFEAARYSTATRIDHDICVVVDRSGSMAWDLTGVEFSYPAELGEGSTLQAYFTPPHATGSRWAAVVNALQLFRAVILQRDLNAKIGLVSYASDYEFGYYNSERVTLDQPLSKSTQLFVDAAIGIGESPIIGDTNIAAGLETGGAALTDPAVSRFTANRTLILLTDGHPTEGLSPDVVAVGLAGQRIDIHTITFGEGANQALMQTVASIGRGEHYHATTDEALSEAFRQIAEQLPAVLTD